MLGFVTSPDRAQKNYLILDPSLKRVRHAQDDFRCLEAPPRGVPSPGRLRHRGWRFN